MIFGLFVAGFCWFFAIKLVIWLISSNESVKDKLVSVSLGALALYALVTCTFGLQYLFDEEKRGYGQLLLAYDVICLYLVYSGVAEKFSFSGSKINGDHVGLLVLSFPIGWSVFSGFLSLSWPYWLMFLEFAFLPFSWLASGFS